MKTINLTQGKVALVDDEDFEFLNRFKWGALHNGGTWYAVHAEWNKGDPKTYQMHRVIMMCVGSNVLIDHANGNGLDNQKNNLRRCNKSQNVSNRTMPKKIGSSKYMGVYWCTTHKRWVASIRKDDRNIPLGKFKSEKEAAISYNKGALRFHGEFAKQNIL